MAAPKVCPHTVGVTIRKFGQKRKKLTRQSHVDISQVDGYSANVGVVDHKDHMEGLGKIKNLIRRSIFEVHQNLLPDI